MILHMVQLNIVEGKMQYLFDESGKRYLDAFAGIVTVSCGHCHPDIVDAITEQNKLLQHATTIYLHHAIADFAEALASKMPGNLKVIYANLNLAYCCCKSRNNTSMQSLFYYTPIDLDLALLFGLPIDKQY